MMDHPPRLLAFSGSARRESYNQRLVQIAAAGARDAGAEVTVLDMQDYPLPLFNEDLERKEGTPENALKLKQLFLDHDGLLIASPEYNGSVSPLLKNTIDWISRSAEGEIPKAAYQNKAAILMATSPGGLGGLRGLVHLRSILSSMGVLVLPDQIAVPFASQAFDNAGQLKEEKQQTRISNLGKSLADVVRKLGD